MMETFLFLLRQQWAAIFARVVVFPEPVGPTNAITNGLSFFSFIGPLTGNMSLIEERNVFSAIALCAGVTTLFLLTIIGSQHLGAMLVISPALGAWLPLILFVPIAVGLTSAMWE